MCSADIRSETVVRLFPVVRTSSTDHCAGSEKPFVSERVIAIGDIHGCFEALKSLVDAIVPTSADTIIGLGDVVDRGPNSKSCVELLLELRSRCKLVLIKGNHEEMMLSVVAQNSPPHEWLKHGGVSTLDSYGFAGDLSVIPEEHVRFLAGGLDFFELDQHFFTHGNYDPKRALADQQPGVLRWTNLVQSTPGRHMSGKKAIVGHTPDPSGEIFDIGHLMCIDTYCYGGQWLTAVDVMGGTVWQTNDEGQLR